MSDLSPILLVLLLIAAAVAFVMYRRTTTLEAQLLAEQKNVKDKHDAAEQVRTQNRTRGRELEELRKQLQDTKSKLKRLQKDQNAQRKASKGALADDPAPSVLNRSAASTVRVTDQALEDEHNRAVEALRQQLAEARTEVKRMQAAESKRQADAQAAADALSGPTKSDSGVATTAPAAAAKPEEQVAALETQLEAFKRAASQQEKKIRRELKKAEARANAAHRRATSSHNLYLVIKAQLELTSNRLALLKRKYEGAMPPEALKPDKVTNGAIDDAAAVVAEAEAEAEAAEAQARAEEEAAGVPPAGTDDAPDEAMAAEALSTEAEAPLTAVEEPTTDEAAATEESVADEAAATEESVADEAAAPEESVADEAATTEKPTTASAEATAVEESAAAAATEATDPPRPEPQG